MIPSRQAPHLRDDPRTLVIIGALVAVGMGILTGWAIVQVPGEVLITVPTRLSTVHLGSMPAVPFALLSALASLGAAVWAVVARRALATRPHFLTLFPPVSTFALGTAFVALFSLHKPAHLTGIIVVTLGAVVAVGLCVFAGLGARAASRTALAAKKNG